MNASGTMAPTRETYEQFVVAMEYVKRNITLKGVAVALGIEEPRVYTRVHSLLACAVRNGWLIPNKKILDSFPGKR